MRKMKIENLIQDLNKEIPMYIPLKGLALAKVAKVPDDDLYRLLITDSLENKEINELNYIAEKILTIQEFQNFFHNYYEPR
jgi:hypothetical protein